jgi:protein disulfide-isomerase A6
MFNFFPKTGNLIRFSILISLFLIINCTDFNFNSIKGIKIKEIGEIQKLLDETDMTYFAFYYKETSENSKKVGELLQKIAIKLDYLTVILLIDCDQENFSDVEMCRIIPDVKDGYPRMEVYSPPEYKYNPYTKQMLKHSVHRYDKKEVGENLIYNFITTYIPARVTKLDPENFENFVNNLDLNKVILFTDKEKTPLLLRGLSNYFYDKLLFGEVGKHETSLLKKFKVKIFPTLIMYQTHEDEILLDEPKIELYDGPINAGHIVSFLEKFAPKERISDLKKKQNDDPSKLKYKVAFKVLKHNEVISYMQKYNERRFVVYLDNNLEKNSISNDLNKFNRETNGFFHFLRINCVESPESQDFCKKTFKVKEFPKLILYNIKNNIKDINTRLEQGGKELSLDFSEIYSEINREIQSEITVTDPQSFTVVLNHTQVKDTVPVIYFFENDDVPLALQLLSTEKKFKKFAEFISLENPPRSLVQNFKFTKLPKLFILLKDKEKPGQ